MKPKRAHNKKYLEWIRTLNCIVHGTSPSEPHHYNAPGHGGTGTKCPDERCIPMCFECHRLIHQIGRKSWLDKHNLNEEFMEQAIEIYNRSWENEARKH